MGREVRRVPPHWEHPKFTPDDATPSVEMAGYYRPCFDTDYETAAGEWIDRFDLWRAGQHEAQPCEYCKYFWDYEPPPDKTTCRPAFAAEPTWYQLYETVSEGTPVSPPFATLEELARYLADQGDFWHQEKPHSFGKPTYEQALAMVTAGLVLTLMIEKTADGVAILEPHQQFGEKSRENSI